MVSFICELSGFGPAKLSAPVQVSSFGFVFGSAGNAVAAFVARCGIGMQTELLCDEGLY